ncbi:hypothetical protein [Ideonella dechloratans]|uniref:hypothetical protein n=1 Tax=Ideonella dechloratans TaxID=36863 RepID=UPI0035B0C5F1
MGVMVRRLFWFFIVIGFFSAGDAGAFSGQVGKVYCTIRHPQEAIASDGVACESQHVIQQQSGGQDDLNTIWISRNQHSYLDRSRCKPWENERPAFPTPLADENIERAYMIGVWAQGYHALIYDHHGEGELTLFAWDGSSHILYLLASMVNLPQKIINNFSYQIERMRKGQETYFFDASLAVAVDIVEVAFGSIYSAVGVVVGTIFNPWDTVRNIPSLVMLSIEAVVNSVWLFLKGVSAVLSFGFVGSCGL